MLCGDVEEQARKRRLWELAGVSGQTPFFHKNLFQAENPNWISQLSLQGLAQSM